MYSAARAVVVVVLWVVVVAVVVVDVAEIGHRHADDHGDEGQAEQEFDGALHFRPPCRATDPVRERLYVRSARGKR